MSQMSQMSLTFEIKKMIFLMSSSLNAHNMTILDTVHAEKYLAFFCHVILAAQPALTK